MKTEKDIRFSPGNFFTKNDKIAIVDFINGNIDLNTGYVSPGEKFSIFHRRTNLHVLVIGTGMLSIGKFVDKGPSYQYNCYANFIINEIEL